TGSATTSGEAGGGEKGRVAADQDGKLPEKIGPPLIPAEKEAADDALRYAQANAGGDGGFHFKNIAPGRYYLLAKPIKDDAAGKASARPQAWDNSERAALRREAEAAGNVIELQNCQRVTDYKLSIHYRDR